MKSKWREHAAPIIARVLSETVGLPENEIRKALRNAYPFGLMEMHPYKIWLSEIRRQRGLDKTKASKPNDTTPITQLDLFEGDTPS